MVISSIFRHDNLFALCWCFFFLLNLPVRGQDVQLPTIIPPSPTAQNFMRYGEIPVDHSTGVPKIEIPIYTVKGRKLELPISISYHASGIKVNDVASEVGLGWVLNAGGIITRSVNGIPDESRRVQRTFKSARELLDSVAAAVPIYDESCACYRSISRFDWYFDTSFPYEDPMSDRYFYRLPSGESGNFMRNYPGDDIIMLPPKPLKVEDWSTYPPLDKDLIKITDDNGTINIFQLYRASATNHVYSEWYLQKIISADHTDTIEFFYKIPELSTIGYDSYALTVRTKDRLNTCDLYPERSPSNLSRSVSGITTLNTPILDSIVSSGIIVKFQYADREDFNSLKRLTDISISAKSPPYTILKKIQFTPKYFGTTAKDKRLGLDNIVMSAPGDAEPQKYAFLYEDQVLPPYPEKMIGRRYSEDFWGYYNGANSTSMVPINFISNPSDKSLFGGNRKPDPTGFYSKACMLKEIKYPTGGKTVFVFERNYANDVYPEESNPQDRNGYVGGFRIGSITNHDENDNISTVKTYAYSGAKVNQVTQGKFLYVTHSVDYIYYNDPLSGWLVDECWVNTTDSVLLSNSLLPVEVVPGLPIIYTTVVEYNGTETQNVGKTVYQYNQPKSIMNPVDHPDHPVHFELPWYYHPYHYDWGNFVPKLISKTQYLSNEASYHPVSKEIYGYTAYLPNQFFTGIKLTRTTKYNDHGAQSPQDYIESIVAIDTKAYQEASLLTKTTRYDFDPLDSTQYVLTSTDYIYNETNLAVSEKLTVSSEDDVLRTTYTYPHDLMPEEPYTTMFEKGIISPVIEESRYNVSQSDKLISKVRTQYKNWGNNIIEPENVQVKKGVDGFFEDRVEYLSYDGFGNVASVRKKDDSPVTYLWGYNGLYPVAEVVGTDHATVSGLVNLQMLIDAGSYTDHQLRTELNKIRDGLAVLGRPFSVVTYTYLPAVGITSQTDTNGATTFYEYDNAGRLVSIKDQHGDIVKTYDYHYRK